MAVKLSQISPEGYAKLNKKWCRFLSDPKKVYENDKGCWIWLGAQTGGVSYREDDKYPAIKVWEVDGGSFTCRGNIIAHFLATSQVPHPFRTCISHRCHHSLCLNPRDLIHETLADNSKRQDCRRRGSCICSNVVKCFPHVSRCLSYVPTLSM